MNGFLPKPFTQEQLVERAAPDRGGARHARETRPDAPVSRRLRKGESQRWHRAGRRRDAGPDRSTRRPLLSDTLVLGLLQTDAGAAPPDHGLPVLDASQIAGDPQPGRPEVLERLCGLLYATAPGPRATARLRSTPRAISTKSPGRPFAEVAGEQPRRAALADQAQPRPAGRGRRPRRHRSRAA